MTLPADRLPGPRAAVVIAFITGSGVLALEVTGARLFIPWFGASILVWSNVIGVTLGAAALGNLLGGLVADRRPYGGLLALLLLGAALLTLAAPFALRPIAEHYLPPDLPLETAFALLPRLSLLVALLVLLPPILLLGAVSPFLVRGALSAGKVGHAAGLVSGAATLGSLFGTFAPVHWWIPAWGSRASCAIAASLLFLAAALALLATRAGGRRRGAAALVLLLAVATAASAPHLRGGGGRASPGATVLAEQETRYQYARVERRGDTTLLRLNEGLDSFHSMTVAGRVTTGAYYDQYGLFPPLLAAAPELRVLVLGFAAGTIARQYLALYGADPRLAIEGVELDPAVSALGPRYFALPADPRLSVVPDQDARVYLDRTSGRFEIIVVDTYAQQVYLPFQTCSREFFAAAKRRLESGGLLLANLNGFGPDDEPLASIANTAAAEFGAVSLLRVQGAHNFVMIARKDGAPPTAPDLAAVPPALAEVEAAAREPGAFVVVRFDPARRVLTDDHAPVEVLADADLGARARRQLEAAMR